MEQKTSSQLLPFTDQVKTQAAVDQLLEERTIDAIVDRLVPEICNPGPTADCPEHLEAVIRQGLPLLAAAQSEDDDYAQVSLLHSHFLGRTSRSSTNMSKCFFCFVIVDINFRFAMPLWKALVR